MRRLPYLLMLSLLALAACIRRPEGVLSDKKMAPVVADLELSEAYMQSQRGMDEETKERLMEYVLEKHGVSRESFDTTMAWYGRNVDEYVAMNKEVDRILSRRRSQLAGAAGGEAELDASDLWPYSGHAVISAKGDKDALTFSIPVSAVEKGDRVVWRFRMRSMVEATALVGVEYNNGLRNLITRKVMPPNKFELSLQTDSALRVVRVFGNLHVPDTKSLPVWVDSLAVTHLPFDSLEYYKIHGQRIISLPQPKSPR